jgi:hypothetical protein
MSKARTPETRIRSWVEGVLSQADDDIAETTLAVLYNSGGLAEGRAAGRHFASAPLATLLHEPFAELGSADPQLAASFVAHAVLGQLSDHLWQRTRPTAAEIDRTVALCVAAAGTSFPTANGRR